MPENEVNNNNTKFAFVNGNIHTSHTTADTLLIEAGRITGVGMSSDLRIDRDAEIIDLEGRTVLPGFCDSHAGFMQWALSQENINLNNCKSIEDISAAINAFKLHSSGLTAWYQGYGLDKGVEPSRYDIDVIVPNTPVILWSADKKTAFVNSAALKEAGITQDMAVSNAGIQKGVDGEPDGILHGGALDIISGAVPAVTDEVLSGLFKIYAKKAAGMGITEIWSDDMAVFNGNFRRMWNFFINEAASDKMPFRLRYYINISSYEDLVEFIGSGLNSGDGIPFCHAGAVKIICDGLESVKLNKIINTAHLAGLQIAAQADSEEAVNMCLDAFESAVKKRATTTRHLMIHARAANDLQIKRMRSLRIGAVVEPEMAAYSESGCRWREMMRSGVTFCSGSGAGLNSGWSSNNLNPVYGLYYAVNRKLLSNDFNTLSPTECLSTGEAIETYTWSAAWNGNNERRRGEIALWRDADFVVLDEDPFKLEPQELADINVNMTICGGHKIEQQ